MPSPASCGCRGARDVGCRMSHQDACGLDVETPVQIPLAEGPATLYEFEFHTDIVLHDLLYLTDRVVREEPGTAPLEENSDGESMCMFVIHF